MSYLYSNITEKIIGAFYNVYNTLGYGFLEKIYENAMEIELEKMGLDFHKQKKIQVFYNNKVIGDYYADFEVNNQVIVELKACENLCKEHEYQLINYLKATHLEVGLLLNFGKKAEFKRLIFTHHK